MALRRFSDNPAATLPLDGTETIPALQAGVDVQVTVSDIVDAASGAVTSVNGATGAVVLALDDLDDVDAAAPSDGDVLTWNDAAGAWEPATGGGGGARDAVTALATSGAVGVDVSLGDYFTLALSGNVTGFTFSGLPGSGKGATIAIRITQDSTARTVAWPASFRWAGGVAPAVSTSSGAVDLLVISTFDNGTTWQADLAKGYA